MPFCSCWGERKGVGGSSQAPWLCSITHDSQPRAPRGGSGDVRQGPHSWVGDDGGDVSGFDSQPDSAAEPGPQWVSSGLVWRVSAQQAEMRCQALPCLCSPLGCACALLGDPGPQALVVVLLGQVGWQRTCPPGDGTALRRCRTHPKTALLGPTGALHAPT